MKVPFFRSKKQPKAKGAALDVASSHPAGRNIDSETETSSGTPATTSPSSVSSTRPSTATPSAIRTSENTIIGTPNFSNSSSNTGNRLSINTSNSNTINNNSLNINGGILMQLSEMEGFLERIDEFQAEAKRLFPENIALDQILDELRDECRRRADYISRVSAPAHAPQPLQQQQQQQRYKAERTTPGASSGGGSEASSSDGHFTMGQEVPSSPRFSGGSRNSSGYFSVPPRPHVSRRSQTSEGSAMHSGFHTHGASSSPRRGSGASPLQQQGYQANHTTDSATVAGLPTGKRHSRVAESRRTAAVQSMFAPTESSSLNPEGKKRHSRIETINNETRPRSRTSTVEHNNHNHHNNSHPRPLSGSVTSPNGFGSANSTVGLHTKSNTMGTVGMHSTTARSSAQTSDYAIGLVIAGIKIEAAVTQSLQASVVSLQFVQQMGLFMQPLHDDDDDYYEAMNGNMQNSKNRVWDRRGMSWPVIGKVVSLPFVCGNMTFVHDFSVVAPLQSQFGGAAGAPPMPRDVVLGNDFFVGNRGRIKGSKLFIEQLCTTVKIPVRMIATR